MRFRWRAKTNFSSHRPVRIDCFRALVVCMHNIFAVNRSGGTRFDIHIFIYFFVHKRTARGWCTAYIYINTSILFVGCTYARARPRDVQAVFCRLHSSTHRVFGARVGWVTATTMYVNMNLNLRNNATVVIIFCRSTSGSSGILWV